MGSHGHLPGSDLETLLTIKKLLPSCYTGGKNAGRNIVDFQQLSKLYLQVSDKDEDIGNEEPKSIGTLKRFVTIINHFEKFPKSWNYLVCFFSESPYPCPLSVNEIDFAEFWNTSDEFILEMYVHYFSNIMY